jgi:hypothetical protein
LFNLIHMSRRYDVGLCDACRILEGDNIVWDSLLMLVLSDSKLTYTVIIRVISNM